MKSETSATCNHSKVRFALQHIQQATLILMAGTVAITILNFAKSVVIADYYGTSAELDVYFLSLTPLRLISGILIGSLQAAFIPAYLDLRVKQGEEKAFAVLATFVVWIGLTLVLISVVIILGNPFISAYLGVGFTIGQLRFTGFLLNLSTILLLLTVYNNFGICIFNAHRQFVFSAFVPLVNGLLSFAYILCFHAQGVSALMYGLIVGMACQTGIVFYTGRQFLPKQRHLLPLLHPDIRNILRLMTPLLIGASLVHMNMAVDQIMASTLPAGSIAALQYANKLHTVFTQMFIMVISTAILPFLAQQAADNDILAMKATFYLTIKRVLYVLLPVSGLIVLTAHPIVRFLFQHGAFSAQSTAATAGAWIAYTLGLPVQAIGILAARMYNALQANTILMYVAGGGIVLNILFNWIGMHFWGHIGIALSTSGVYLIITCILLLILRTRLSQRQAMHQEKEHV